MKDEKPFFISKFRQIKSKNGKEIKLRKKKLYGGRLNVEINPQTSGAK